MLGLGLGSHKASALRSLAAKLLAKLRARSTYYENNQDSKDTIHEIDNYELLDKATILLTPTATSDARVHSVKTYTGENILIGNNSTFDSDVGDWVSYGAGTPSHSTDKLEVSVTASEGGAMIPTNSLFTGGQSGKTLKVRAKLWLGTMTNTAFKAYIGGVQENVTISSTPTYYEFYLKPTGSGNLIIYKTTISGSEGTFFIDDVSVVDVSSDFDFDRASSATRINSSGLVQDMQSITDPELVLNGDFEELGSEEVTNGTFDTDSNWSATNGATITGGVLNIDYNLGNGSTTQSNVFTIGKTYKIQLNVDDSSTGTARINSGVLATILSNGLNTFYIEATGTTLEIRNHVNFVGSIDNVSVKEVDPNDRWTLGTGWSIEDGVATCDGTQTSISSLTTTSGLSIQNKLVEVIFDLTRTAGSLTVTLQGTGSNDLSNLDSNGTYSFLATSVDSTSQLLFKANTDFIGTIDNVSVKDITFSDDVDLARINYDSNGDNGHILLEPTSTNLVTYSEDFSEWTLGNNSTLTYESDVVAPDGSLGVYRLQNPATFSTFIQSPSFSNSNPLTVSLYVKSTGSGNDNFNFYTGTSVSDLKTATSEWQRFDYTADGSSMYIVNDGDTFITDIYIWGAQAEALSYATSYIPTLTGSTVTRAAETLNGSGNSTLINTTQGTIYLESKLGGTTGTKLFSIGGGTNNGNPAVTIGYTGQNMYMDIVDSGSLIATPGDRTITGINLNSYNKMAIKYTTTNVTVYLNGVQKHTETIDFTPATNVLEALYAGYGTGSKFEGEVKALAVFNEALSDTELANLTS